MAAPNLLSIENRIAVVRDYAQLWQQFFTHFSDRSDTRVITQQEEADFGNIVSILAFNQYKFQELAGDYFKDSSKVLDVLFEAVSLEHLKSVPDATFGKLQLDWHTLFIGMNKALGKLLGSLPPEKLAQLQGGGQQPAK